MRWSGALVGALAAGVIACGRTTDDQHASTRARYDHVERIEGTFVVIPGAPDPVACEEAGDCVLGHVISVDGCCPAYPMASQSKAWRDWAAARRASAACRDATCPPLPPPAMRQCSTEHRCIEHRCRDSCPPREPPP